MHHPYVTIENHCNKPTLKVSSDKSIVRYPLTKAGCLQAGREMYTWFGVESWTCSSSVDFPQEVKKGFRWDVRELMAEGYRQEMEKAEAPHKSVVNKAVAFCHRSAEFLASLDPAEAKAWEALYERVNGGE